MNYCFLIKKERLIVVAERKKNMKTESPKMNYYLKYELCTTQTKRQKESEKESHHKDILWA